MPRSSEQRRDRSLLTLRRLTHSLGEIALSVILRRGPGEQFDRAVEFGLTEKAMDVFAQDSPVAGRLCCLSTTGGPIAKAETVGPIGRLAVLDVLHSFLKVVGIEGLQDLGRIPEPPEPSL